MIVTQGKNLFPEELENLLASHPLIRNASVHGLFDAVRGAQVIAVLHPFEACTTDTFPNARSLAQWCQSQLDTFKTPRQFFICADWPMTASGKTDHASIHLALLRSCGMSSDTPPVNAALQPCLRLLS
jgi:acyl-CoA synthetase (AMP-forming)/AMP-acid ligase II